jgi:hypothetical protein
MSEKLSYLCTYYHLISYSKHQCSCNLMQQNTHPLISNGTKRSLKQVYLENDEKL